MENNNLKNRIQKNVKEKIAISTIREEICMNKRKNKKVIYTVLSSCAVLAICFGITINKLPNNNNEYALENDYPKIESLHSGIEDLEQNKEENIQSSNLIDNVEETIEKPVEEQDSGVKEMPNEIFNSTYPDYYGGKYVDSNGNNVVLLCEDNEVNRKEICKWLGITENKTIFKKAKYSYIYLEQLQTKISNAMSNKELPFVTSSALRDDTNNIVVTVTSNDEKYIEKIKKLDTIGGAIEIKFSENNAVHELLEKK